MEILGYDARNPDVVVPEFTADFGNKKGEKVDYAILKDKKPFILVEAKHHSEDLDKHNEQLFRYFNATTEVKYAILTNGIEYHFFTDIEKANCMDKDPFLVINLENLKQRDIAVLKRFVRDNLDLDKISNAAREKKYCRKIQEIFKNEIKNPSDDFITFFARQLTERRMTDSTIKEFRTYVRKSFEELIDVLANDKLDELKKKINEENDNTQSLNEEITDETKEIITTEEELQGFYIVKAILASAGVNLKEISYKDTYSYFNILYQGKVIKWICRLYFKNPKKKNVSFPDEPNQGIEKLEDLYSLKENILKSFQSRQ